MATKLCPNCGGPLEQLKDGRFLCIADNVMFKIEEDGSARPIDTDPLGKIYRRIDELEKKITPAAPGQPSTVDLQPEDQEDDGI